MTLYEGQSIKTETFRLIVIVIVDRYIRQVCGGLC